MPSKPRVLVVIRPSLYQLLFPTEVDGMLREFADVTFNAEEREWDSTELAHRIAGHDAVITGWGTPVFAQEVLDAATRLRLIAHSAGTIKRMLPPDVFARGIAVTSAAAAIAPAVAEMTLLLIMLCLRKVHLLDRMLKQGIAWHETKMIGLGQELAGKRVGVVGAGHTGRCVIKLLHALEAEMWVHDPYLDDERAQQIGVQSVPLETLFAECPIVTIQAPPTQETYHMVRAEHLALLADGAIVINTARSHIIDQDALLAELQSGRIQAALDVFDQEPLPTDHPYLSLDNVIVTPHVAGASVQARHRQGKLVTDEIRSFFKHEHLRHEVTAAMLRTMA